MVVITSYHITGIRKAQAWWFLQPISIFNPIWKPVIWYFCRDFLINDTVSILNKLLKSKMNDIIPINLFWKTVFLMYTGNKLQFGYYGFSYSFDRYHYISDDIRIYIISCSGRLSLYYPKTLFQESDSLMCTKVFVYFYAKIILDAQNRDKLM